MRSRAVAIAAVAVFVSASACGTHGLSFKQDHRVDIVSPNDRSKVDLPLTVKWTTKNFAASPGGNAFGVVIDRTPPRSSKTLPWLFKGDDSCKGDAGRALCASPAFLAERSVYTTTDPAFTVDHVAKLTGNQRRRQFHELTVVLLDSQGRRLGEGAWSVLFEVKKPA